MAAEVVVPEILQFMIRKGSGLLCIAMPRDVLEAKGIPRLTSIFDSMMPTIGDPVARMQGSLARRGNAGTPFHVPIDLRGQLSGISIVDRTATIQALISENSSIDDFEVPGHLFTLGSHPEGLRGRIGHTETAVELCKLAGLKPAGLLCELVGDEGEMRRGEDLEAFASAHSLEIFPVTEVVAATLESVKT